MNLSYITQKNKRVNLLVVLTTLDLMIGNANDFNEINNWKRNFIKNVEICVTNFIVCVLRFGYPSLLRVRLES